MIPIKIIKHLTPSPLEKYGDILRPFENWETTSTGAGWYSKIPEDFYKTQLYYPLTALVQNSWEALEKLRVDHREFKKLVEYTCPYNNYIHFWCVPILIFTKDVKLWTARYKVTREEKYLDDKWMRKFLPPQIRDTLPFSKIQRALLGPGYTCMTSVTDGKGHLYDALVALDNGDFLGVKVWIWFNK